MVQTAVALPKDNYEYVKCVVVGDSGVGKTCLTCAWSVGTIYTMESLVKSHMSTVFAVDHFMKDKHVCRYINVIKKLIFYCLYALFYISTSMKREILF